MFIGEKRLLFAASRDDLSLFRSSHVSQYSTFLVIP